MGWSASALKKQHFEFLMKLIWGKITTLADVVAAQIVASRPAPGFVPAETHSQPTKRTRLKTKSIIAATLGKSNSSNGAQDLRNCSGVALTAEQIVSSEMENIKKMEQLNEDEWSALADLCFW